MIEKQDLLLLTESIQSKIFFIRGKKVLIDRHLGELYGVETRTLNQAVKRNSDRFPEDFMFQLNEEEWASLRSQIVILKTRGKHIKYLPFAFTEPGVAMLSSVLNSQRAIQVNIQIIRVFIKLREMVLGHKDLKRKIEILERKYKGHDHQIQTIFQVINELLEPSEKKQQKRIGFIKE